MEGYLVGPGDNALHDIDSWDDTEILRVFDNAIKSHSVKKGNECNKQGLKCTVETIDDTKRSGKSGLPGPWQNVDKSQEKSPNLNQRTVHFSKEKVEDIRRELESGADLYPEKVLPSGQDDSCSYWNSQQYEQVWSAPSAQYPSTLPPLAGSHQIFSADEDEQTALSELLLSWYHCGFAAAKYQMILEKRRKCESKES